MKKEDNFGITLIALVITIIVLLILAGITIAILTGDNGILTKATESSETSEREKTRERIGLSVQAANIEGRGQLEYNNLNEELKKEFGEDNYKILNVGKGYLIIVDNVQYKIDADGKVEEGKEIGKSNIEYAGDLSKGRTYDGTTEETAYRINCIEDLVEWSNKYSKYNSSYMELEKTLDFESIESYNDCTAITTDINGNGQLEPLIQELTTGTGFKPIGSFGGNFDGKNNEIRNLYENRTGNAGLFAYAGGSSIIFDLGVTGEITKTVVHTYGGAGGIAGAGNPVLKNCYSKCTVKSVDYAGGLIGHGGVNSANKIYNCYNLGNVEATGAAGGIIGKNYGDGCDLKVYNCYNTGTVKSVGSAGGISGDLNGRTTMTNCYNSGIIIGEYSGGISGYCVIGYIYNCFNVGNIKSTSTEDVKAAGLICHFRAFNKSNLEQTYYLNNVEVAVARNQWSNTLNYKGNAKDEAYMCSQEFVDTLNNYVDSYESDEKVTLLKWKYNEGNYPTFE